MIEKVEELISNAVEGHLLDFKSEVYRLKNDPKKNELLKDICAFANQGSRDDKFIIIGVVERDGKADSFNDVDTSLSDANYQQFVQHHIEPKISFEYRLFKKEEYNLSYFRIFNNEDRPYLLKRDSPSNNGISLREGSGFIRQNSSTRPLVRSDYDMIYYDKLRRIDRREHLQIEPEVGLVSDENTNLHGWPYLDVSITNNSNHSIGFNIELWIDRHDCITIEEAEIASGDGELLPFGITMPTLSISIREEGDKVIFSTPPLRKTCDVLLDQKSREDHIFNRQILFLSKSPEVEAILILKCDEFTNGPLTRKLSFNNPRTSTYSLRGF